MVTLALTWLENSKAACLLDAREMAGRMGRVDELSDDNFDNKNRSHIPSILRKRTSDRWC